MSSVFIGEALGITLFKLAREERVTGALVGVVVDFRMSSATLLLSSTASAKICSPVGPFLTSSRATVRPASVLYTPAVALKDSRILSSSVSGAAILASSSAYWRAFSSSFFYLSFSRRSCQPRFFVSSSTVVGTLALTAVGF